jgi:hypothetical protein
MIMILISKMTLGRGGNKGRHLEATGMKEKRTDHETQRKEREDLLRLKQNTCWLISPILAM